MENRIIKFRAWDTENKEFFKPIYEAYKGNLLDLSISFSGELNRRTLKIPCEHESMFKDRYILSQFTGLHDKNGKEIYEGDLYKIANGNKEIYRIMFVNGSFCAGKNEESCVPMNWNVEYDEHNEATDDIILGNLTKQMEVIGNKFVNPELTK